MQQQHIKNRKQILNLLNIENMIDQYLNSERPKAKVLYNHKNINVNRNDIEVPLQTRSCKNKNQSLYVSNRINNNQQTQFFKQGSREIIKNSSTIDAPIYNAKNVRAISLHNIGKKNVTQSVLNESARSKANKIFSQRHKVPIVKNKIDRLLLRGNTQATIVQNDINDIKDIKVQEKNKFQTYNSQYQNCLKTESKQQQIENKKEIKVSNYSKTNSVLQCKQKGYSYKSFKIQTQKPKIIKNRYQLLNVIGRGMSGSVYKAKDILSNRYIAIKVIQPNAKQYEFIKQISHKNIVGYYNNFIENGMRYLVLEYFPMTLATLAKTKRLRKDQIRNIFSQIVDGVLYLHGMSIAHRDIKLDNIVITEDMKTVKFIDFGLCSDINNDSANILTTQTSDEREKKEQSKHSKNICKQFCGTPNYMAPQIICKQTYDPKKSDIWSLGVLLYALTVGRYPFQGSSQNDTFHKIKNKKVVFPGNFQQSLKDLITKMLMKEPQNRPTILDVLRDSWFKQQ